MVVSRGRKGCTGAEESSINSDIGGKNLIDLCIPTFPVNFEVVHFDK